MSSTDRGLVTPDNCAVLLVDHQPQILSGVANIDRQTLLNNVLLLAKAAKTFGVPVILTTLESRELNGQVVPPLLDLFPDQTPIERSSLNPWDHEPFAAAVRHTGRKNVVIGALWSETSLVFLALPMLEEGFGVYAVEDASGGTSPVAHAAAIRRMEQAGAVSLTALQVLLEFQRDWSRRTHFAEVMAALREHGGAYGQGIASAAAMMRHGSSAVGANSFATR